MKTGPKPNTTTQISQLATEMDNLSNEIHDAYGAFTEANKQNLQRLRVIQSKLGMLAAILKTHDKETNEEN